MKIRAERKPLAEAVAWVAQALPKNHAIPALSGIRISAGDDGLTLQAFDHEIGHTATVECDVVTPGEVLVSGRFLAMIIAGLKGAEVDLVLEDGSLSVTSARSSYRVRTMPVGDYPDLPEFAGRVGMVDAAVLVDLIRIVGAPVDDNSPISEAIGIHLESDGDGTLWAVGSSGVVSVHVATATWTPEAPIDATAPRPAITAAIKGMSGAVEIGREDGLLSLRAADRVVTMRTLAGTYLNGAWRKVLSTTEASTPIVVEVDASELLAAAKAITALNGEKMSALNLQIEHDSITVLSGSEHGDGREVIEASGPEQELRVAVASHLLGFALSPFTGGPVRVCLSDAGKNGVKPMLFRHPDHDDARIVVMPRKWTGGDPR